MEQVFVDTGAWLAIADRSDAHHKEAVEVLSDIQRRCRLITTNLVIAETYVLVRRNLGHGAAIKFLTAGFTLLPSPDQGHISKTE